MGLAQPSAQRLCDASPVWSVEADAIVGYDLSFTKGLRVRGVDLTCAADSALQGFSERLADLLSQVPEGHVLRFSSQQLAPNSDLLGRYRSQFAHHPIGASWAAEKTAHLRARWAPLERELHCFVSTPATGRFNPYNPGTTSRRCAGVAARLREVHRESLAAVGRTCSLLVHGLRALGMLCEPLSGDDLFQTVWTMANPLTAAAGLPSPHYRADLTLRSQVFACGLLDDVDFFTREDGQHRVITWRSPPACVQPTAAIELQRLPFVHRVVVSLRRVPDAEAQRRIEGIRRQGHEWNRVLDKIRGARRNAEMPDHAVRQQQTDSNEVLARIARGERLYDVALQIWIAARDHETLVERTRMTLEAIRKCGRAEGAVEELRGRDAFLSTLPGHHGLIGDRYHAMLASRAADLLPLFQAWRGAGDPVAVLTTRHRELVGFAPFLSELRAWNAVVAGSAGSGKSFLVRLLLLGWLCRQGRTVVVTRGGDYHRYAEVLGGTVYDVDLDDPTLRLSPFPAREHINDGVLAHLTSVLGVMVAEPGNILTRAQKRLLFKALQSLYESAGDPSPQSDRPCLADVPDALRRVAGEHGQDAEPIVRQLRYWIDGPYGHAFSRNREEEESEQRGHLEVWNLASIEDADTQGVVLALLSGIIAQSIKISPTVVLLDEVWAILRSEAGTELVENLYRTVRKEGSSIWTISQSMNDYASLEERCRAAILNNSEMKFFLAHDPSELAAVVETFELNPREKAMLRSLRSVPGRFSECLAFFGDRGRQVLRLHPTPIEYWLATSHPKDAEAERQVRNAYPRSSRLAVVRMLAKQHPHGALHVR